MEEVFQSCVAEARDRGRTVLLSSHVLSEVEALCDRISIIRKGRTVESGSLGELRHLTRTSVVAELAGPPDGLAALPGVHGLSAQPIRGSRGHRVELQADTDTLDAVLRVLGAMRHPQPHQHAAHPGRALPAPLPGRRPWRSGGRAMTALAAPSPHPPPAPVIWRAPAPWCASPCAATG